VRGFLFGVSAHDPIAYIAVAASISTFGVLAALVPAMRAAAIDPIVALRHEST
jgi:ABC-type lipoprotein release transport system permease subunit